MAKQPAICLLFLFFIIILHTAVSIGDEEVLPRIGIIGAGISGTSSAHFLRQLFGKEAKIDVFEAERVGGRTALIDIDGKKYEAGGSIIHKSNRYMVNFAKAFNKSEDQLPHSAGFLGLYGDSGMVFQTSQWNAITIAKLLWRYGLDLYTVQEWTKNLLVNFDRIYTFQDNGMAFTTVEDMLRAMGDELLNKTHYSLNDVLRDAGFSQRFIDELAMAAMRCNYGQTTQVHGLVGAVSLIGAEPGLWSVEGGNRLIPMNLLEASKASLIQAKVTTVALIRDELGSGSVTYEVEYETKDADGKDKTSSKEYDIVIVATPVFGTKNKIEFVDFPNPVTSFSQDFHTTIAMFVQGRINTSTFDISSQDDFPPDVFTISPDLYFNSVGKQSPVTPEAEKKETDPDQAVWKTFLNKVPTEEQIDRLFSSRKDLRLVDWLAYPKYEPNMDLPPFMLYDRLYYVNAVESAASAMEMSAIGARNVALLAFNQWQGNFEKIDELHLPSSESSASENERSDL